LQISSDERARVARIAELFSEEDLTRHLQIMLRTFNELGYRQEQRFHLELGLLKMAHAQRLLPIEQLLSEAGVSGAAPQARPAARPSIVAENRGAAPPAQSRGNFVSPFAADSARKVFKPEMTAESAPSIGPRIVPNASAPPAVIMGSAVPEHTAEPAIEPVPAVPPAESEVPKQAELTVDSVRNAVLNALSDAGHRMLVSMLETGEWSIEGSELIVKVEASAKVIDMSLGADAKRLAIATASGSLGKPAKLKVLPGGTAQAVAPRTSGASNGGGQARAEQDPIVKRLQEKFGAEIRTIIDQRDKK
jgi:DNA polymerase-3 subunit gamma/tau